MTFTLLLWIFIEIYKIHDINIPILTRIFHFDTTQGILLPISPSLFIPWRQAHQQRYELEGTRQIPWESKSHFLRNGTSSVPDPLFPVSQFSHSTLSNLIRKRPKKAEPVQQAALAKDYRNNLPFEDSIVVLGLTILAAIVRLWRIDYPTSVVFDEVHFGGFATK